MLLIRPAHLLLLLLPLAPLSADPPPQSPPILEFVPPPPSTYPLTPHAIFYPETYTVAPQPIYIYVQPTVIGSYPPKPLFNTSPISAAIRQSEKNTFARPTTLSIPANLLPALKTSHPQPNTSPTLTNTAQPSEYTPLQKKIESATLPANLHLPAPAFASSDSPPISSLVPNPDLAALLDKYYALHVIYGARPPAPPTPTPKPIEYPPVFDYPTIPSDLLPSIQKYDPQPGTPIPCYLPSLPFLRVPPSQLNAVPFRPESPLYKSPVLNPTHNQNAPDLIKALN